MGTQNIFELIKERVNLQEYVQNILGITIKNNRGVSFLGGTNPTETIYGERYWYCFKHGKGGSIIDLVALHKFNGDIYQAVRYLCELYNIPVTYNESDFENSLEKKIDGYHKNLLESKIKAVKLLDRGIIWDYIKTFKIGLFNQRFYIPYYKSGQVVYWISWGDEPKYLKMKGPSPLWGLHTIKRDNKDLWITEGTFDALTIDMLGGSVLSSMGGNFSQEQLEQLKLLAGNFKNIILAFDADDAGEKFTWKMLNYLYPLGVNIKVIRDYNGCKDVNEYYVANKCNLKQFKKLSVDDYLYIINYFLGDEDTEGLIEFLKKYCKFQDKLKNVLLFEHLRGLKIFPNKFIQELEKTVTHKVDEQEIADVIKSKYILRYSDTLGFYEFKKYCWDKIEDTQVKNYISSELGNFNKGYYINSIYTILKAQLHNLVEYNKLPYHNFLNGVLELDTGKLYPHSPAYNITHLTSIEYNEKAQCSRWIQFIEEITGGDKIKAEVLQLMAGYILFPDNRFQKAFFLLGEGSNGKSVFLNTISKLFDSRAISNIEICHLNQPFQRVKLLTSILNISSEARTKMEESEAIFKQVVAGDKINACYKNKDFIEFRPRTKFITACNNFIDTQDISEGFLRRLYFIKFTSRFIKNPTAPNEYLVDVELEKKLNQELPGIFNWVYEGYKLLRQLDNFPTTLEHEEVLNDFLKSINPLYTFLKNLFEIYSAERLFIEQSKFFNAYKIWCFENGIQPKKIMNLKRDLIYAKGFNNIFVSEQVYKNKRGFLIINLKDKKAIA